VKKRTVNARIVLGLIVLAAASVLPGRALAAPPDPAAPSPSAAPTPSPILPPPPSEPLLLLPPPPAEPSVTRGTVALVAAGVALAAASAGSVFGALALQNKSDFDRNPTYSSNDQGSNDAAYADGCFALALAAGVTSLVLYLTRDAGQDPHPISTTAKKAVALFSASPLLTPLTRHGGGAGVLLRF
jgi:hypothetical protein